MTLNHDAVIEQLRRHIEGDEQSIARVQATRLDAVEEIERYDAHIRELRAQINARQDAIDGLTRDALRNNEMVPRG